MNHRHYSNYIWNVLEREFERNFPTECRSHGQKTGDPTSPDTIDGGKRRFFDFVRSFGKRTSQGANSIKRGAAASANLRRSAGGNNVVSSCATQKRRSSMSSWTYPRISRTWAGSLVPPGLS